MSQEIETRIINKMFDVLAGRGWHAVEVFDGEDDIETTDRAQILQIVFDVEFSGIRFQKDDRIHTVTLVTGNGWDVIADYGYSESDDFDPAMQEVAAWIEQEELKQ
jgi:hypothetical protein